MFVCYLIADVIHCTVLLPGSFAISISLRFCRFLVQQCVLFFVTGVLSHCYTFSLKLLLCFSFPGMRSSLVCLFPHDRCYSLLPLFPAREVFFVVASQPMQFIALFWLFCNQHFAFVLPVFSLSICFVPPYRRFIALLYIFSKATTFSFSFPGMRSSFIRLVPHGRCYSLHFALLLPAGIYLVHCFVIITGFFPSLCYHTSYSKLCFSFSGMRSSLFVVASWPMFFIALLLWFITQAF